MAAFHQQRCNFTCLTSNQILIFWTKTKQHFCRTCNCQTFPRFLWLMLHIWAYLIQSPHNLFPDLQLLDSQNIISSWWLKPPPSHVFVKVCGNRPPNLCAQQENYWLHTKKRVVEAGSSPSKPSFSGSCVDGRNSARVDK